MPAYKLCYFNARGLAEMCRLVFAEAGVSFEDVRYTGEEWSKHKPGTMRHVKIFLVVTILPKILTSKMKRIKRKLRFELDFKLGLELSLRFGF